MDIVNKAANLLNNSTEVTLASVNEKGYPRVCVLSKIKSDQLKKIYFSTGLTGAKVRHFKKNPKASVCVWKAGNSITLIGTVTIRTDKEIREEMWLDWFIDHFPGGIDDPNYCIVEFTTTEEATLWIDEEFVTLESDKL